MNRIAGPHRFQPAEIVDTGAEQRMRSEWTTTRGEPHGNGRRVPSGSRKAAKDGLLRGLLVEVKRLRIIFGREADDVVLRHRYPFALEAHAEFQILEPLDHAILAHNPAERGAITPGSIP